MWALLLTTSVVGALAVVLIFAIAAAVASGVSGTGGVFVVGVIYMGTIVAIPAGLICWLGGLVGWLVGRALHRDALGALIGCLTVTAIPAILVLSLAEPFTAFLATVFVIGGSGAALAFYFEARWHRIARETSVVA